MNAVNASYLFPLLPREEALARAAELDAALHRAMRERGELLIDPKHLKLAARAADCCATCNRPVSPYEAVAIDWKRRLVYHGGCR